jgi:hypothetical protein
VHILPVTDVSLWRLLVAHTPKSSSLIDSDGAHTDNNLLVASVLAYVWSFAWILRWICYDSMWQVVTAEPF